MRRQCRRRLRWAKSICSRRARGARAREIGEARCGSMARFFFATSVDPIATALHAAVGTWCTMVVVEICAPFWIDAISAFAAVGKVATPSSANFSADGTALKNPVVTIGGSAYKDARIDQRRTIFEIRRAAISALGSWVVGVHGVAGSECGDPGVIAFIARRAELSAGALDAIRTLPASVVCVWAAGLPRAGPTVGHAAPSVGCVPAIKRIPVEIDGSGDRARSTNGRVRELWRPTGAASGVRIGQVIDAMSVGPAVF